MQCPKCYSHNVSSNKFKDDTYHKIAHAGHAGHRAGYHTFAAGAMALVGVMKLADKFVTADWRCDSCGWTFS
ncbi:MAG TPA: hypothetical protein VGN36_01585 [Sphingorhabdus sp.]|jgi:hypothetical protein|nr:hypothetical protein [Sphingorhabdus sp.]